MRIGVPKERMRDEFRVALTPALAGALVAQGHGVFIEAGAGEGAGFADRDYDAVGATVTDAATAFAADLVVKVKCPLPEEYGRLRAGQTLFAFLHFDGNAAREDIESIVARGVTGIAYEWVEVEGRFPLLEPMSRITGVLFARRALELLLESRRHLGGAYGLGIPGARAMVIGAGGIGAHAITTLARNEVRLVLVDKHPETLGARLRAAWPGWSEALVDRVISFDEARPEEAVGALRGELPRLDIVIGAAVRRPACPPERCRYLVDRAAVATMRSGSVLCDATAEIRNFFETAVPTTALRETYVECGVIHYNCEHLPSMAAHTATELLTAATFPYVRALAEGTVQALRGSAALRRGTLCRAGRLTDLVTARKKGIVYTPLELTL